MTRGVLSAAAALALWAAPAHAAVEIGQTGAGTGCGSPETWVQRTTAAEPSYATPPGGGVITSWSTLAMSAAPSTQVKLGLFRPGAAPNQFTTVVVSELRTLVPGQLNTFATRIPVAGGDHLGVLVFTGNYLCAFSVTEPGAIVDADIANAFETGTHAYPSPVPNHRVNVSAVVEPDCDSDGFGDETQDSNIVSCDRTPPETMITKGPKPKTKKKSATFEFTGTDARAVAGFECSLNAAPFAACTSPVTVRGKQGANNFFVRAIDDAGNVDQGVASYRWRVKKKKGKK